MGKVRGRIAFHHVSFRYQPHLLTMLNGLCLTVEPGEYAALVGPSESGKSTRYSLIPRFYDVTEDPCC